MAFSKLSEKGIDLSSTSTFGIGISDPQVPLDVDQVTGDDIRISASSSDYWGINAGNYFTINDSGTLRLRIYDNGKTILGDDVTPETLLHIADTDTTAYEASSTGVNSYTPQGGDLLQVQNRSAGTDNVYAGIWFETGNPATNTTGSNRPGRFALVVDNSAAYGADFVWQLRTTDAGFDEKLRLTHEGKLQLNTTNNTYAVEIEAAGDNGIRMASTSSHASLFLDSASGSGQYIRFSQNGTSKWWINSNENEDLNFRPNAETGGLLRLQGDDNKVYIENDKDSTADTNYYFTNINYTPTGSDACTADRTHCGLFVNTDSSATGGDTSEEHRVYGVYSDCRATADSDLLYAVYGYSRSDHSSGQISAQIGVYGAALAHSDAGGTHSVITGVQGVAASYAVEGVPTVRGGYFLAQATATGDGNINAFEGVRSETQVDSGYTGTITTGYTFRAMHDNNNGSTHTQNTHYLFYGDYTGTLPTTARGLWITDDVPSRFTGDLEVQGTLTKTSGSFKISHPLPELNETHDLVHSFVESPQPDNIYSGMVTLINGSATINIDTAAGMTEGTFVLLNKNIRRTVTNEEGFTAVKSSLSGNILTITAQDNTCTDEVFWMVIGQRNDAEIKALRTTDSEGNLIVEPEKGPEWVKEEATEPETTFDLENPIPE